MAVFNTMTGSTLVSSAVTVPAQPIDVEAWTEQVQPLDAIYVASPGGVRGNSVSLAIDLDEERKAGEEVNPTNRPHRRLLRRDSLDHREALLKGKQGSRRRIRWENDRLISNPWAQLPLPSDWEVHPTHPKHHVPYYMAPLWDQELAARTEAKKERQAASRKKAQVDDEAQGKIPRELREKLKKARAAKSLLRDLEEQVRLFVENWEQKENNDKKERRDSELDCEDDEIVFVGRNGQMRDMAPSPTFKDSEDEDVDERKAERDRLVFDSLANDQGASFGRWLVHSIGSYYGLRTWSRTVGDPARREAYVGIPSIEKAGRPTSPEMPRPLWGLV